jgi:hypothetical protein
MIREALQTGYNRTVGALRNRLVGLFSSVAGGGFLQLLYVIIVVALMAGFVNAVFFPIPDQAIIVYPGGGAQTIAEAILDAFVIVVGGAGVYLTYMSGRQTTKSRTVNMYLALALLLILASLLIGINLAIQKGYG